MSPSSSSDELTTPKLSPTLHPLVHFDRRSCENACKRDAGCVEVDGSFQCDCFYTTYGGTICDTDVIGWRNDAESPNEFTLDTVKPEGRIRILFQISEEIKKVSKRSRSKRSTKESSQVIASFNTDNESNSFGIYLRTPDKQVFVKYFNGSTTDVIPVRLCAERFVNHTNFILSDLKNLHNLAVIWDTVGNKATLLLNGRLMLPPGSISPELCMQYLVLQKSDIPNEFSQIDMGNENSAEIEKIHIGWSGSVNDTSRGKVLPFNGPMGGIMLDDQELIMKAAARSKNTHLYKLNDLKIAKQVQIGQSTTPISWFDLNQLTDASKNGSGSSFLFPWTMMTSVCVAMFFTLLLLLIVCLLLLCMKCRRRKHSQKPTVAKNSYSEALIIKNGHHEGDQNIKLLNQTNHSNGNQNGFNNNAIHALNNNGLHHKQSNGSTPVSCHLKVMNELRLTPRLKDHRLENASFGYDSVPDSFTTSQSEEGALLTLSNSMSPSSQFNAYNQSPVTRALLQRVNAKLPCSVVNNSFEADSKNRSNNPLLSRDKSIENYAVSKDGCLMITQSRFLTAMPEIWDLRANMQCKTLPDAMAKENRSFFNHFGLNKPRRLAHRQHKLLLANGDSHLISIKLSTLSCWTLPACIPVKSPLSTAYTRAVWDAAVIPGNDRFVLLLHAPNLGRERRDVPRSVAGMSVWDCERNVIFRRFELQIKTGLRVGCLGEDPAVQLISQQVKESRFCMNRGDNDNRSRILISWHLTNDKHVESAHVPFDIGRLVIAPCQQYLEEINSGRYVMKGRIPDVLQVPQVNYFHARIDCILLICDDFAVAGNQWGSVVLWRVSSGEILGLLPDPSNEGKYDNLQDLTLDTTKCDQDFQITSMQICREEQALGDHKRCWLVAGDTRGCLRLWFINCPGQSKTPQIALHSLLSTGVSAEGITCVDLFQPGAEDQTPAKRMLLASGDTGGCIRIWALPSMTQLAHLSAACECSLLKVEMFGPGVQVLTLVQNNPPDGNDDFNSSRVITQDANCLVIWRLAQNSCGQKRVEIRCSSTGNGNDESHAEDECDSIVQNGTLPDLHHGMEVDDDLSSISSGEIVDFDGLPPRNGGSQLAAMNVMVNGSTDPRHSWL